MMMMMLRLVKKEEKPLRSLLIGLSRRWVSSVLSFGDGSSSGALGLPTSVMVMGSDSYEPSPVPGPTFPASPPVTTTPSPSLLSVTFGLGAATMKPNSGVASTLLGKHGMNLKRVEGLDQVSFGWGHALALTKDGKLFGWGYSADGRLGRIGETFENSPLEARAGMLKMTEETSNSILETAEKLVLEGMEKEKDIPIIWEPCLIEELRVVEVIDVACGLDHSLILCRDGTLLSGGSNIYGQLGRVVQDLGLFPVDISFHPISIASGLGHSLAICKNPSAEDATSIVSWGWNQSSQLGRDGPENLPAMVEGWQEKPHVQFQAGMNIPLLLHLTEKSGFGAAVEMEGLD